MIVNRREIAGGARQAAFKHIYPPALRICLCVRSPNFSGPSERGQILVSQHSGFGFPDFADDGSGKKGWR
eukprot:768640-Hanusia_phi.AAC.15